MKPLLLLLLITTGINAQITTTFQYQYKISNKDTILISKKPVLYYWTHNDKMTILQRKSQYEDASSFPFFLENHDYKNMPNYFTASFSSPMKMSGIVIIGIMQKYIQFITYNEDSQYIQLYTNEDPN